jgi:hypothetical protein
MANYKTRSDAEAWWSSQPSNRGKTYPGDDIAEKQYDLNKARGENNLSIAKSFFNRFTSSKPKVDLGDVSKFSKELGSSDRDPNEYPRDEEGNISLNAKGGKINLKNCKISTHEKNSKHKHNW